MSTDIAHGQKKGPTKAPHVTSRLKPLEHFRAVLRSLPWPHDNDGNALRTLAVTSCRRREGVSTAASQIAAAAASADNPRVILIDANIRTPALHRMLKLKRGPGFAEFVRNENTFAETVKHVGNLAVLTAGQTLTDGADVYDSALVVDKLNELSDYFDLVVLDLPPAGSDSAAVKIAGFCDGTLLVIESEQTNREVAYRTKQLLSRGNAKLLGAVLNKRQVVLPKWLYG